jgi:hypothetical protein
LPTDISRKNNIKFIDPLINNKIGSLFRLPYVTMLLKYFSDLQFLKEIHYKINPHYGVVDDLYLIKLKDSILKGSLIVGKPFKSGSKVHCPSFYYSGHPYDRIILETIRLLIMLERDHYIDNWSIIKEIKQRVGIKKIICAYNTLPYGQLNELDFKKIDFSTVLQDYVKSPFDLYLLQKCIFGAIDAGYCKFNYTETTIEGHILSETLCNLYFKSFVDEVKPGIQIFRYLDYWIAITTREGPDNRSDYTSNIDQDILYLKQLIIKNGLSPYPILKSIESSGYPLVYFGVNWEFGSDGSLLISIPIKPLIAYLNRLGFCDRLGRPTHNGKWVHLEVPEIIIKYNRYLNTVLDYYLSLISSIDKKDLNSIQHIFLYSLAKTLAVKFKTTIAKLFGKYGKNLDLLRGGATTTTMGPFKYRNDSRFLYRSCYFRVREPNVKKFACLVREENIFRKRDHRRLLDPVEK